MAQTYYDVLGITPAATSTLIRAAYRARIREEHPDQGGNPEAAALINLAYDVLSDDAARSEYDRTVTVEQAPPQPPPAESVWDQPQPTVPTTPTPQGAYGYMPQEPVTQTVHPRPSFVPPVSAWRRPKLVRRAGIVTAAWLIPMIILAAMSTSRAVEMDAPGGSLLVWSLIPAAATLAVLMLRPSSRWWVRITSDAPGDS